MWRGDAFFLKLALRRSRLDAATSSFILTVVKGVMLTLAEVQAPAEVGITTPVLLASLGIAGLTIGCTAKDALSNMISGMLIFRDRPFVIGDLAEIGGECGRVDRITLALHT